MITPTRTLPPLFSFQRASDLATGARPVAAEVLPYQPLRAKRGVSTPLMVSAAAKSGRQQQQLAAQPVPPVQVGWECMILSSRSSGSIAAVIAPCHGSLSVLVVLSHVSVWNQPMTWLDHWGSREAATTTIAVIAHSLRCPSPVAGWCQCHPPGGCARGHEGDGYQVGTCQDLNQIQQLTQGGNASTAW